MKKLDILDNDIFIPEIIYLGSQIDENNALVSFDNWITSTRANVTIGFDFATLGTGYNLRGSITGRAHFGTACSTQGTNVVEFDGTYRVVHVTAQMIAINLGASFDGVTSTFIVSEYVDPNNKNRWSFSVCSATDINDFINSLHFPTCFDTTSAISTKPSVTPDPYTGQLFNPDVVCKRDTNSSASYTCKTPGVYNNQTPQGDIVCPNIYCYIPGSDALCGRTYSTDGLICDVGKRCLNGVCQAADSILT